MTKFRVETLKKKIFFLNAFLSFNESLIGMTDKFSHYFGVFVFVFSLTNVVRTVQAFSLYLGPKLYFNLNQISTYFVNKFLVIIILAEHHEKECKPDWNFAFQVPTGSTVNRIATRTFKEKTTTPKPILSSDLNFNVYIDVDNRERARARDKKQRRPISS